MVKLFFPVNLPEGDFLETGRYKMIWRLSVIFTITFAFLTAVFFNTSKPVEGSLYLIVFTLSLLSLWYLKVFRNTKTIFWVFAISATLIVTYSTNVIVDTLHYSDILWVVCIIMFAFVGLGQKAAYFFIAYHAAGISYFIFFRLNYHIEHLTPRSDLELTSNAVEMVFSLMVLSYLIYQNIKFQEFSYNALQKTNKTLEEQNKENLTLLREVHHRVKNNLQIVISLLRMQSADIRSQETRDQFNEAIQRIMTISLIHQKLYQSSELSRIHFTNYFRELVNEIISLHLGKREVEVEIHSEIEHLDLRNIVPIGLIMNELITNSIKHAFGDSSKGKISISFSDEPSRVKAFRYSDNGTWKENSVKGFGLELIESLSDQMEATLERKGSSLEIQWRSNH